MKSEINEKIKQQKSSKGKMVSSVSLYSRSSERSDPDEASQEMDVTGLSHMNETF